MHFEPPRLLSESELNTIRGKALVGHATPQEILRVFGHLDMLEFSLDEMEQGGNFGAMAWREYLKIPD